MKAFKKNPVLSLILGIIMLAAMIIFILEVEQIYTIKNFEVGKLISGVVILGLSYVLIFPEFQKRKGNVKFIYFLELAVFLVVGILGFILPAFGINPMKQGFNTRNWIAIILLIHGLVSLTVSYLSAGKPNGLSYALYLILYGGGAYLLGSNAISLLAINWTIIIIIGLVGLYLFVIGLMNLKK